MNKANVLKRNVINIILDLGLFQVTGGLDKKDWILLKNGERAPVFLNTAKFISHPNLNKKIGQLIFQIIQEKNIEFDRVMGLPYGGLPFAYSLSFHKNIPCLAIRKEGVKKYSTSGEILGDHKKGQQVLLIEDATATANTAIGFVKRLRTNSLKVKDIITIVDIGGTANKNLRKEKVVLHTLFTWSELYKGYKDKNLSSMNKDVIVFLDNLFK